MNLNGFTYALLLVLSFSELEAQLITPTVAEVQTASAKTEHLSLEAGEKAPLVLTFDVPAPRQLDIAGYFALASGMDGIHFSGIMPKGSRELRVTLQVPGNADGGDYTLSSVGITGEKRLVTVQLQPPITLHVEPLPKLAETLPTRAFAELTLDQRHIYKGSGASAFRSS